MICESYRRLVSTTCVADLSRRMRSVSVEGNSANFGNPPEPDKQYYIGNK